MALPSRQDLADDRRRRTALGVLLLFVSLNLAGWLHLGHVEHAPCDVHGELCHVDGLDGKTRPPEARDGHGRAPTDGPDPGDEHRCAWQGIFRDRATPLAILPVLDCGALVAPAPPVPALRAPLARERLYLLAPKGSPPRV